MRRRPVIHVAIEVTEVNTYGDRSVLYAREQIAIPVDEADGFSVQEIYDRVLANGRRVMPKENEQ